MPLNTTYSQEPDVAIKGLVADSRRGFNTITKVAAADTLPGLFMTIDGNGKAALPTAGTDYIIGATIWTTTLVTDESGVAAWGADKALPITQEDPIWMEAADTVTANTLIYAGFNGNVYGTAGATTSVQPVGRAETSALVGELVRVKLLPALQGA